MKFAVLCTNLDVLESVHLYSGSQMSTYINIKLKRKQFFYLAKNTGLMCGVHV